MKTKLKMLGLLLVSVLLLANCSDDDEPNTPKKKEPPKITMTTAKAVGEKIKLWINAEAADQAGIWIDLNNNGKKDSGEEVTTSQTFNLVEYELKAQTITLYGKVAKLSCSSNQLTQLDVSKNTQLVYLGCSKNQLPQLDVSKNTQLEDLGCYENQLTQLDVSKNIKLTGLWCGGNQLTELDVNKNTILEKLDCYKNSLTQLDVSKNGALYLLLCNKNPKLTKLNVANGNNKNFEYHWSSRAFDATGCPQLKCIKVDKGFNPDAQTGDKRWKKDATASYRNDGSECP